MALTLNIRVTEDFYIDGKQFILDSIESPTACVVKRVVDGALFKVSDSHSTQVYPDTRIFVGLDSQNTYIRLAFEAPKSIKILTGSNFRAASAKNG